MPPRLRLLYLNTWLTDFAAFLVMFSVTRSLGEAAVGVGQMGLIGGLQAIGVAIASILSGLATGRFGWRRVMLAGLLLNAATIIVCGQTGIDDLLRYLSYFCMGVSLGMIYPPLYAGLSQAPSQGRHMHVVGRTVVLFSLAWNLGMVSGQLTGGWLFRISPLWPMYFALPLVAFNLLLFVLSGRSSATVRTIQLQTNDSSAADHYDPVAGEFVKLAWIANLGSAFCFSMVLNLLPDMMVRLGVLSDLHGLLIAISRAVTILMYFVLFCSTFWHLRLMPALASQLLGIIGMVILSLAHNVAMLGLGLVCLGQLSGFNYFSSLFYSTRGSSSQRRGFIVGLNEASFSFGFAAGALLGGYAGYLGGPRAPYQLGALVLGAGAIIQIVIYIVFFHLRGGGMRGRQVE